ncbi:helix-turn-helix transcriptional regulator [Spiractinospora alimapuensis]|uniref:winged helix-turn-helix transcriptional regulator n=1 Tax=Spiractinospora alimapuensis TaxID=2820884 RepID=UPI001F331ACB|nr:helix-turn-helix domain-containing protein [Spiractinospora alimapuensis]QVQ50116.1 helix-turn-helix transcriptional regulator [Spiractinospora alimapuensis]
MRSYADACGITRALDLVGERWAIPVVRELMFGPRRYSDLATALPGVSTNILGSRLKELTEAGVVEKRRLPAPAASTVYALTPWGEALEPVLIALGRWAAHTPTDLENHAFSASSFALSLKTTFDPVAAAEVNVRLCLEMGEDVFDAEVGDGAFAIQRSPDPARASASTTRVVAEPKTLADLVYADLDLTEATRNGSLRLDGSARSVDSFTRCFTLPERQKEGIR